MNLRKDLYNSSFSHIYVEKQVIDHSTTKDILAKFPGSQIIMIEHYKDVFNRRHQDRRTQYAGRALILAANEGSVLYEGAPVCQDFGNEFFYYTSNVMNCIYDCEYCYLKGMYPSANIVVFVNLEDTFAEIEKMLEEHSAYVCVSYDTDLTALEDITGFVSKWSSFTDAHPGLKTEIRTKSPRTDIYGRLTPCSRVIFAYTISPEYAVFEYEHGTGSMKQRIQAAAAALDRGFRVRLCFDPMIYCPDWEKEYEDMLQAVTENIDLSRVTDVSVGSFRISQEYMKQMRKNYPDSAVVQFPYVNEHGVYQYPERIRETMENYLVSELKKHMPEDRIFRWEK